ncbi:adhesion G protein-coupled receptor E3-like [Eleutherodactylus coqui]|uniref:adhesion G protein-coupled receptor E3-like n=1 Tax=Eleutherodactylus coqui TaxID=57060 RepID=UPI0034632E35
MGIRYLPPEAANFRRCDPSLNECPANASCEETIKGYYCACGDDFFNVKEKMTITYPGGECLEYCSAKENTSPCACRRGSVLRSNENGLYVCSDKCRKNSDCPSEATCTAENCYCKVCKPQGNNCITLVKLDEVCPDPSTTANPLLTSTVDIEVTTVYMEPDSSTPQPAPNATTGQWLTSSVNMKDTAAYTHQRIKETTFYPFTTSTSVTTHSMSQRTTEEQGTLTPQPVIEKCNTISRTNEREECKEQSHTKPQCALLESLRYITENACEKNTNTSVQTVATQITNVLNQTSLTTLNITNLQEVFIAVIENVETSLLASFTVELNNQHINTSKIEAKMQVAPDFCVDESSLILTIDDNKMEVPCSLVNFTGGGAMFISYKGLNDKLNGSILASFGDSCHANEEEVITLVFGGTITRNNTENLPAPVSFDLQHLMALKPFHDLRCVFWDIKKEFWSTHGCRTEQLNGENRTRCICTHLSTFAVIMAPTKIQVDVGLKLLSVIGLSLSLVCLCLSFLTFILCRSLRSAHTSVLTVLCVCLFLGQLLVLVGLQQTSNKILCSVIAGSLKFFFLCAFCWMSLESILLFLTVRNLQALNYMNSQRSHFPYVCLVGFGIPSIIIIVSASIHPDMYGEETHCWLKIDYVWSFLGPVCMFIVVNFILLVLTFWLLRKKLSSLNSNVSTLKHTRLLTFKAFSQLFILGCTWIIGFFQFGSGSIIASYIFTICNSLQGVYLFIVHCLLNHQVREEYSRAYRRLYSKQPVSEIVSGSTMAMTIKPVSLSVV